MSVRLEPFSTVFSISDSEHISVEEAASEIDSIGEDVFSLSLDTRREASTEEAPRDEASGHVSGGKTCVACGIAAFEDDIEQRIHFKTDWHRCNVKLRALNKKPVLREEDFNAMVEQGRDLDDDVGSISGSDDDDGSKDNEVKEDSSRLAPYCLFRVDSNNVAVWKCLVVPSSSSRYSKRLDSASCFKKLQDIKSKKQQWAVVMLQGGHFAACVYSIESPSESILQRRDKASYEIADLSMKEVIHKSFHRYVVRAKAGGKQSEKDATGKVAKSAGSRLRRYNEAMLNKQVLETLGEWKDILSNCSLIFVSCPGSNRLVLFGGDAPPLDKNDERIRKIPFVTRRPTISETKRVVRTLLTVYKYTSIEFHRVEQREEKSDAVKVSQESCTEERRRADKLEIQKQQLMAQERNRKKKERRKEQKRAARTKETKPEEATVSGRELDNLEAELKSLAAAATESMVKRSMANTKKNPPPQEKARSKKNNSEDISTRREKLAAAAEARAKALAAASSSQKLW